MSTVNLSRKYPMLLSVGSALFTARARRRLRWWKLAAGALVAWQAARNLRD